jgi:copper chaperone NosL
MKYVITLGLLFLMLSCNTEPVPIEFGKDMCYTCKMTMMDSKFGAEIVTKKGKIYKFDDVNCMLDFYHSDYEEQQNIKHLLVINFAKPSEFIDATNSWYLKSDSIRSPMASGIAAFASDEEYAPYKKNWKAILMSWGETNTQFK